MSHARPHASRRRAALLTICLLTAAGSLAAQGRGGGLPAAGPPVPEDAPGLQVLREVHGRYSATRFRTLTFTQRTTFPDGRIEWWYEAESVPGKARVDVAPFTDKNTQIFRNDSAYVFRSGEITQQSAGLAITMWALMDMYAIPPEKTAAQMSRRRPRAPGRLPGHRHGRDPRQGDARHVLQLGHPDLAAAVRPRR